MQTLNGPIEYYSQMSVAYEKFANLLHNKIMGCKLDVGQQLVVECRALLSAYDDFIIGLRANQALYEEQKSMYSRKVGQLQADYDVMVGRLLIAAERQGIDIQAVLDSVPVTGYFVERAIERTDDEST